MISIKTLILAVFVGLLALGAQAEKTALRGQEEHTPRRLQETGIYEIIHGALDFAEAVTKLCTSSAAEDAAVREFCDEAY